jgi:uncharacterized protein YggE
MMKESLTACFHYRRISLMRLEIRCLLLCTFALAPVTWSQTPKPLPQAVELDYTPTLTVMGRGEVMAAPDRAVVRLGAQAQAADAAAAQSTVNQTITKALADLRKLGIEQRSIQTAGLNLFPVYAPHRPGSESDEPRVTGYRAANTIQVALDDLALVGKVIDTGVAAGVNRLEGVTFELRNDLPQRSEALRRAIEEAKSKAKTMAPALEVKLGRLREVVEGGISIEPPQPILAKAERFAMSATSTPVQPGELRVEATVTLRYEIAP